MPITQCNGCGAAFKVPLASVDQRLTCPKCNTRFKAQVKHGARGSKQDSPRGLAWAIGIVVVFIVVVIVVTVQKSPPQSDDPKTANAGSGAGTSGGVVRSDFDPMSSQPSTPRANPAIPNKDLESAAKRLLGEIADNDDMGLKSLIDFASFYDASRAPSDDPWSLLSSVDSVAFKDRTVAEILGTPEERAFLKAADPLVCNVVNSTPLDGEVYLQHRDPANEALLQEHTLRFGRPTGGKLMLFSYHAGPIQDPTAPDAVSLSDVANADSAAEEGGEDAVVPAQPTRPKRHLGTIAKVAHLDDTPDAERTRLDGLAAQLLTLDRNASKARRELVAAGKPAIPPLLNVVADHGSMTSDDQLQVVNMAIQGLRDITKRQFGFSPSRNAGSMAGAESDQARLEAVQSWFGWWDKNRATWTVPVDAPPSDEG